MRPFDVIVVVIVVGHQSVGFMRVMISSMAVRVMMTVVVIVVVVMMESVAFSGGVHFGP